MFPLCVTLRDQVIRRFGCSSRPVFSSRLVEVLRWRGAGTKKANWPPSRYCAAGGNEFGQLGDGTNTDRSSATRVMASFVVTTVAASRSHSLFVTNAGHTYATVRNQLTLFQSIYQRRRLGMELWAHARVRFSFLQMGLPPVHSMFAAHDGLMVSTPASI